MAVTLYSQSPGFQITAQLGQVPAGLPGAPAPASSAGTSDRAPAAAAMRRSTSAGPKREWRTSSRDPKQHPEAVLPDFGKPDPLLTFKLSDVAFVYGSKWKQRYFTKVGDDYFPLPAQWDVTHQRVAAVLGAAEHRLVGAVLSGGQHAAADRAAVRRLPFGQLQRADEDGRPNGTSGASDATVPAASTCSGRAPRTSSIPRRLDLRSRERHVHPVPLAGTAAEESNRRAVLRLAGRLPSGRQPEGLLEARRAQARRDDRSRISRTERPTRTACRATTSSRARCTRRGVTLLQLPRRARHREQRRPDQAGTRSVPDLPRSDIAERPACGHDRGPHAPSARQRGQRMRGVPHAEDRADHRGRERPQPHVRVHHAGDDRSAEDPESVHELPRRPDDGVGHRGAEAVAGDLTMARELTDASSPHVGGRLRYLFCCGSSLRPACRVRPAHAYRPFNQTDAAVVDGGQLEIECGPVRGSLVEEDGRSNSCRADTELQTHHLWDLVFRLVISSCWIVTPRGEHSLRDTAISVKHVLRRGVPEHRHWTEHRARGGPAAARRRRGPRRRRQPGWHRFTALVGYHAACEGLAGAHPRTASGRRGRRTIWSKDHRDGPSGPSESFCSKRMQSSLFQAWCGGRYLAPGRDLLARCRMANSASGRRRPARIPRAGFTWTVPLGASRQAYMGLPLFSASQPRTMR